MTTFSSPTSAAAIVSARSCGRSGCACARSVKAGHGVTHCPAHEDNSPSLSVSEEHGDVLFNCHAGCDQMAVLRAFQNLGFFKAPEQNGAVYTNGANGTHASAGKVEMRYSYLTPAQEQVFHVRIERPNAKKIMWWEREDGTHSLPEGIGMEHLPLYRWADVTARPDEPVLVFEGEKKTDAAVAHGFLAVSVPGGSSQKRFGTSLQVLARRDVVLVPDNDTPGRGLMQHLTGMLRGTAKSVRTVSLPNLPDAGDVYDFFAAGHTADELRALIAACPKPAEPAPIKALPKPKKARDLQIAGLPEIGFAVGGILPEGVTLCAGRPKQGKSFLALNLAIAVAAGGKALGDLSVTQGDVLYLTLEGGEHGFLPRLNTMLAGALAPDALEYQTEWPRLDQGGAELIGMWLVEHPAAKLVVVDTLAKVRTPTNAKSGIYEQDYEAVQSLVKLALDHHVAILLIHHTRKAVADDPLDTVSGSTGLTGAVDAVWILQRVRGQGNATLTVSGRNLPDDDLGLEWDDRLCCWRHAGEAADVKRSAERQAVLNILRSEGDGGALTAQEIADLLERDFVTVRQTLARMVRSGELRSSGQGSRGGYRIASTSNEGDRSHVSQQSQVNEVSQVSHVGTSDTSALHQHVTPVTGTRTGAGAPAHASIEHPPEDDDPPCPNGCGMRLREGYCYACKKSFRELSP